MSAFFFGKRESEPDIEADLSPAGIQSWKWMFERVFWEFAACRSDPIERDLAFRLYDDKDRLYYLLDERGLSDLEPYIAVHWMFQKGIPA